MAGNGKKAGHFCNGGKWLEWLEIAGNGWNGLKWIEITGNGCNWL